MPIAQQFSNKLFWDRKKTHEQIIKKYYKPMLWREIKVYIRNAIYVKLQIE